MTFDDLRVFMAVCQAGNLSAVARELSCTQPAVSQHVKRLEQATGVRLLERRRDGVVPTPEGLVLYAAASDGIAGLDLALRRLGEFARGEAGSVRLHTGATTIRHFMSEAITEFRQRFPRAALEFRTTTSSRQSFDALIDGMVDLAWVTIGGTVSGIEFRPVVELPWVLATHDDDPLAHRPAISPTDLTDIRHIRLPQHSASRRHLETALTRLGIHLTSETGVTDWNTAVLLAELGAGHAIVPALSYNSATTTEPRIRYLPLPFVPPLTVGWAVRRWDSLTPLARAFADLVEQQCRTRHSTVPRPPSEPGT
ncbi:LysR family transcriptional regulator [Nocardia sp. ET3-3]|uniref:LysR family transcriptional regulator n=1 Tax=Nocardia terrae TaxID=2675851 RepID=A0A7K1V6W4_9NOCA|nr:LysR family transcriptional regulator [Nocardia terrae]MVU82346.1 LysR family transcriptional regulator [Nocardia terrae]